jgi:hypothetical protein
MSYVFKRPARIVVVALASVVALTIVGAASAEFPTKRSDPSVHGTAQEGQTLSGQTGQWLMDNGLNCTDCTFTYTWQRCNADSSGCVDVPGATGFNYTLTAADVGKRIRLVEWIFKRDCGAHNTQTGTIECHDITKNGVSALTVPVAPKPVTLPQATAVPTVQGVAMEDETLRATGGQWGGPAATSKQLYWQRCNTAGEGCATIPNAVGAIYKIPSSDVGARLRVVEAATNAGGTAYSPSAVTAVVVELRPTAFRKTVTVDKVSLPHRLVLNQVLTKQTGQTVTIRVRVGDDRGFRVGGVLVKAVATGILSGAGAERLSSADGWATFTFKASGSGATWVYVEARKKGESPQSGISTANLFRVHVR